MCRIAENQELGGLATTVDRCDGLAAVSPHVAVHRLRGRIPGNKKGSLASGRDEPLHAVARGDDQRFMTESPGG